MKLDIEVGDVILTGKFKNKSVEVKEFGTDDKGQPTINGRPMLTFRIKKLIPEIDVNRVLELAGLDEEKKRDYKQEYADYHSKPEQKKNRAKRNGARRKLASQGRVRKGDGKDVDHKKSLKSGGGNSDSNLRVRDRSANRGDKTK